MAHTNIYHIITKIELQNYTISMKAHTHLSCQQNPKGPTYLLQSSLLHNTHYKACCYTTPRGIHQTAQTTKTTSKLPAKWHNRTAPQIIVYHTAWCSAVCGFIIWKPHRTAPHPLYIYKIRTKDQYINNLIP